MEVQIKSWLKAGIMKNTLLTTTFEKVFQEDTMFSLLTNIALYGLESEVIDFMRNLKLIDENKKKFDKKAEVRQYKYYSLLG